MRGMTKSAVRVARKAQAVGRRSFPTYGSRTSRHDFTRPSFQDSPDFASALCQATALVTLSTVLAEDALQAAPAQALSPRSLSPALAHRERLRPA